MLTVILDGFLKNLGFLKNIGQACLFYPRPMKSEGGIHLVRPPGRPSVRLSVDDKVSGA